MRKIYEIRAYPEFTRDNNITTKFGKDYKWSAFFSSKKKAIAEIEHHLTWLEIENKAVTCEHYNEKENHACYKNTNDIITHFYITEHWLF